MSLAGNTFADLAGSPPKARRITVVGDFIVMGNLDEGGTQYPNRVRWSGFNNSEAWGLTIPFKKEGTR